MNTEIKEMLQYLIYVVLTVSIPVLTTYFTNWLKEKTNQTKFDEIAKIVTNVVEETNQTYVDSLKEAGKFTENEQAIALNKSLTKAVSLLSEDLKKLIMKHSSSIEDYLKTLIESYIKTSKSPERQ